MMVMRVVRERWLFLSIAAHWLLQVSCPFAGFVRLWPRLLRLLCYGQSWLRTHLWGLAHAIRRLAAHHAEH
jgi:hypothetical protein